MVAQLRLLLGLLLGLLASLRSADAWGCGFLFAKSPSCMLNGAPCPLPAWVPDWSLRNSTAMMAHRAAFPATPFAPRHRWGLATIDWGVNGQLDTSGTWAGRDPEHATCEATSTANCLALKRSGRVARCGIYHNVELSLVHLARTRNRRGRPQRCTITKHLKGHRGLC